MTLLVLALLLALATAAGANTAPNWRVLDRDIHKAISYSSRTWHVSASWLHACAHSEGGHGRFIINSVRSSGWFQFQPSTFTWMSNAAWKEGRKRGLVRPPLRYKRLDSRLGQAYTAGWAFSRGLSYHWYGRGC